MEIDHDPFSMLPSLSREAVAALLLFVAATVLVTRLSRATSTSSLYRAALLAVVTGQVVVLLLLRALSSLVLLVSTQARNVVSDILAFPAYLKPRLLLFRSSQRRGGRGADDYSSEQEAGQVEVDDASYRLLLEGFYSLRSSSHSAAPAQDNNNENANEASLFDYSEIPPSQLQALQDLRRPPNRFLPSDFPTLPSQDTAWKQFQVEAGQPWLWLHTKILGFLLFGLESVIGDLLRIGIYLLLLGGGGTDISLLRLLLLIVRIGMRCMMLKYWFHAFCRSTSRVCTRWNPCFQEQGYSVQFCSHDEKCYLLFRR